MQRHNRLSAAMQVTCAAVVAQATPQGQHVILRGSCKISYRGKALQKPGVVLHNRTDLRLLKHDFRQPHKVGVARVLPRQGVASVRLLPAHNLFGKLTRELRNQNNKIRKC